MENNENSVIIQERIQEPVTLTKSLAPLGSIEGFETGLRMAKAIAASNLVPIAFQGDKGIPNVLIALELANRLGMSPFAVMQNLNVIQGKPSFSSTFLIAMVNSSGKFAHLRFEFTGEGSERSCYAWTTDREGNRLEGPTVTMQMAAQEGWLGKTGSKWKTMPDLMMRYRAASFFSRIYAPEITMGMHSEFEVIDSSEAITVPTTPTEPKPTVSTADAAKAALKKQNQKPENGELF
jgi:hypothetical protein